MQWLVEVTSLDKTDKEILQIPAETWQAALQEARARRGESPTISGFSFDLMNDGCRAVDPSSKTRYEIRRAGEGEFPIADPISSGPPRHQPPTAAKIVFKREQERTPSSPLTYREYVYAVPQGTSEAAAEALLRAQLERVRTSLAALAAGKLVNLAVFDRPFEGKPGVPPLVTLSWRDWRGAAVVAFPNRAQPASGIPFAGAAKVPIPVSTAGTPPMPPAQLSIERPAPAEPSRQAEHGFEPAPTQTAQRSRALGSRVRGEDLIADLFETMHDLHFLRDAIEGGDFCLSISMEKIPSHIGIIHLYDIDHREFVIANARGAGASALLLRRHPETEALLARAMRKQKAIVIDDATLGDIATIERYAAVGGARSLVVAPVMQAGRFLAAMELLNPIDGQPFTEGDADAVMYVADQFAEFLANRGIAIEPERITSRRSG